jgi:hypothetical protein
LFGLNVEVVGESCHASLALALALDLDLDLVLPPLSRIFSQNKDYSCPLFFIQGGITPVLRLLGGDRYIYFPAKKPYEICWLFVIVASLI